MNHVLRRVRPSRDAWKNAALALASTVLTLALLDRALCLIYPPFAIGGSILVADPSLGWKLRANTVVPEWQLRTNSAGFRGEEFQARGDRPMVAFLGDSVTYGAAGQEFTFPRIFEQLTGVTSQNYGVPYYGPLEYEKVLPIALGYHPDLVVLGFFVGNDVVDCAPRNTAFLGSELDGDRPWYGWSWSGIYRFLLFRGILDWRSLRGPAAGSSDPGGPPSEDRFTAMELDRIQVFRASAYPAQWDCLRASLDRARASRPDLIVLILPDQLQVDDTLWGRLMVKTGHPEHFDRSLPNRRINQLAREFGLRVIDATPALEASTEPTYIPWDSHPNQEGNRIIGRLLAETLGPLARSALPR